MRHEDKMGMLRPECPELSVQFHGLVLSFIPDGIPSFD